MQEEWDYARYGPGLHERDPRLRSVARVFLLLLGAGLAGRAATKLRPLPYCDSSDQTDRGLPPCTPCPFKGTCQRGELLHCGSGYELRRGRCSPTSDLVLLASDIADRYSRVICAPVVQEGCSFIAPAQDGVGDTPSMADALHGTGLPEALLHEPNASAAASEAVALATLALTGGGGVDADLLTVQPAARGSGDEFLDDMTPGAARQLRRLRARFGAAHPGCDAFRPLLCSVLPGGRSTRQAMGAGAAFCLLLLVAYHWLPARWRRGVGAGSRRQPPERLVRRRSLQRSGSGSGSGGASLDAHERQRRRVTYGTRVNLRNRRRSSLGQRGTE